MGREAEGHCRWNGQDGVVRAILEREALILRGEIRMRIPRQDLLRWQVDQDCLTLQTTQGPVDLALGAKEAAAWVKALDKPVPSLAERLGLDQPCAVLVGELPAAIVLPAPPVARDQARLALAVLHAVPDLDQLVAMLGDCRVPLWCVHQKGSRAAVADRQIRASLRAVGWMDTKVSAVDDLWTATRYHPPRG